MNDAYRSEETRLQAQRRLLAEKFLLTSSDEEDVDEKGAGDQGGKQREDNDVGVEDVQNTKDKQNTNGKVKESEDGIVDGKGDDDGDHEKQSENDKGPWPGMVFGKDGTIWREGTYKEDRWDPLDVADRKLRVSGVAKYASVFGRGQGRRVCASDSVVCYAVGGHVRVIERHCGKKALLKGHGAAVIDMELLREEYPEPAENKLSWSVILGTVGEDGRTILWKVAGGASEGKDLSVLRIAELVYRGAEKHEGEVWGHWSTIKGQITLQAKGQPHQWANKFALTDAAGKTVEIKSVDYQTGECRAVGSLLLKENEGPTAVEWLDDEYLLVAYDDKVTVWNVDKMEKVESLKTTSNVLAVHRFRTETKRNVHTWMFVVSIEAGRVLQVYHMDQTGKTEKQQELRIRSENEDAYISTSVVPGGQYIVSSDIASYKLYAMHVNEHLGVIDTITAVPVAQPVLSLYTTVKFQSATVEKSTGTRSEEKISAEISIWVVQPRSINIIHLPAHLLLPSTTMTILKGAAKAIVGQKMGTSDADVVEVAEARPLKPSLTLKTSPTTFAEPISSEKHKGSLTRRDLPEQRKQNATRTTIAAKSTDAELAEEKQERGTADTAGPPSVLHSVPVSTSDHAPGQISMQRAENVSTPAKESGTPTQASSTRADSGSLIMEAVGAVLEKWEQRGIELEEKEKRTTARLTATVRGTTNDTLQRAADNAMHTVVKNAIESAMQKEITMEMFSSAIRKAKIADHFDEACLEMKRQIRMTIVRHFEMKYEKDLLPTLRQALQTREILNDTVKEIMKEISSSQTKFYHHKDEKDIDKRIREYIQNGKVNQAFDLALNIDNDEETEKYVMMLCHFYNHRNFFMEYSLKLKTTLLLIQELGRALLYGENDVLFRLEWLREALLGTDLENVNDDSSDNALDEGERKKTLSGLVEKLKKVRIDALEGKDVKIAKLAKIVGYLVSSAAKE